MRQWRRRDLAGCPRLFARTRPARLPGFVENDGCREHRSNPVDEKVRIVEREYPLLAALMAPSSVAEFLDEHWPRSAFATHGPRARLPAMMLDKLLSSPIELAHGYSGRLRFTGGGCERMVQVADVSAATLQDMGLTLQFVDIGLCVPGAPAFMRQLEAELGLHEGSVSISAFNAPREGGLRCHYDAQDLISVQLHGTKEFHHAPMQEIRNPFGWQFMPMGPDFEDLYPQAGDGFPDPRRASFKTAHLQPGSVLFLPRGTWHYTEASDDSLSLSIMIDPVPALQCALDQLRLLLLQDGDWRQPLYGARGSGRNYAAARAQAAILLAALPAIVARLAPEDLLDSSSGPDRCLEQIDSGSRFQRTPYAHLECRPGEVSGMHKLAVRFGHTASLTQRSAHADISAATLSVFQWIEAQTAGPFSGAAVQAAFPAAPFAVLKDVLSLCVRTQFLKLLRFPPLGTPS